MTYPATQRLANGLLIHHYYRSSQVIGLGLALSYGSRHDPWRKAGLAHLLEHMVFCGSRGWTQQKINDDVNRRGGQYNGNVNAQRTFYHILLPCAELEFGLHFLRQIVFEPSFPSGALAKEKRIVHIEDDYSGSEWSYYLGRWMASLGLRPRMLTVWAYSVLLKNTGLQVPTIGFVNSRARISLADICAQHRQHYTADRAVLLAVGDLDTQDLLVKTRAHFDNLQPSATLVDPFAPPASLKRLGRWRSPVKTNGYMRSLIIAYALGEIAADELASMYFTRSVLYDLILNYLRFKLGLAYDITLQLFVFGRGGLVIFYAPVPEYLLVRIEKGLIEIFDQFASGTITEATWADWKQAALGGWRVNTESVASYLNWLSTESLIFTNTPPPDMVTALTEIRRADLRRFVSRHLHPDRRLILVHQPALWHTLGAGLLSWLILAVLCWGAVKILPLVIQYLQTFRR